MVFGPKFQAFRLVLYITIIVTIIVILIDPDGSRTRALEQNSVSGSPWIARWFALVVLFLLYFTCISGRGHLAWILLVFTVIITAFVVISFNFIIPQVNSAQNPVVDLETQLLFDCDGYGDTSARKFVTPIYY